MNARIARHVLSLATAGVSLVAAVLLGPLGALAQVPLNFARDELTESRRRRRMGHAARLGPKRP